MEPSERRHHPVGQHRPGEWHRTPGGGCC